MRWLEAVTQNTFLGTKKYLALMAALALPSEGNPAARTLEFVLESARVEELKVDFILGTSFGRSTGTEPQI